MASRNLKNRRPRTSRPGVRHTFRILGKVFTCKTPDAELATLVNSLHGLVVAMRDCLQNVDGQSAADWVALHGRPLTKGQRDVVLKAEVGAAQLWRAKLETGNWELATRSWHDRAAAVF